MGEPYYREPTVLESEETESHSVRLREYRDGTRELRVGDAHEEVVFSTWAQWDALVEAVNRIWISEREASEETE